MKTISIYKRKIGQKEKPYIIIEACVNHQGNINIAKKMIDTSKLSREEMIGYLDNQTGYRRNELENMSDDKLTSSYRSVFNSRNR
jgi:sialic acid synthase SpsE